MDNSISAVREQEGNGKKPFPKFGNGKGMKKNIPKIRKRKGMKKIFPKFGNGKGMKSGATSVDMTKHSYDLR